jgi:hypothetical protein
MALEFVSWFASDDHSIKPKHKAPEIAEALRQALAQPVDAAIVAEVGIWGDTAPPKREWVGLDEVEVTGMTCECVDDGTFNMSCAHDFARAIEAKLKEKNT